MTFEIEKFLKDAKALLNGNKNSCELEALEPYLTISIKRINNEYNINIQFVYNRKNGDKFKFEETLPKYEIEGFISDLSEQLIKYPVRKI